MTPSEFFNFDYSNGRRLTNDQLFKDTAELCKLNRKAFNLYLRVKALPTRNRLCLFRRMNYLCRRIWASIRSGW